MIAPSTVSFLQSLKNHNNKLWFEKNRDKYLAAKNNFEEFVDGLLEKMVLFDNGLKDLTAKDCCFRINRDIRFSKNKTPYKINFSAYFSKGGKKSVYSGYYFHLQPGGNSFVGGGLWHPEAAELKKLRQEIDYCFPEFKKILQGASFKRHFGDLESDSNQLLVNVPRGYDKDNPAAGFLRMKSFVAVEKIDDGDLTASRLGPEILAAFKALLPLLQFINRSFD